jgi:hypothetical protein
MRSTIWISYDLGVRGDYESLYTWLDSHKAKECGDSLAVLTYVYKGDLLEALKNDLGSAIAMNKRTRIYIIHRDKVSSLVKGNFIYGGRRVPAWNGFSSNGHETDEEV